MTLTKSAAQTPETDSQGTASISAFGKARATVSGAPLNAEQLKKIDVDLS